MSGRYTFIYEAYIGIITDLCIILLTAFDFKVGISFTFGSRFSLQASESSVDTSADLFSIYVTNEDEHHVFRSVPIVIIVDQLTQTWVFQVFRQSDNRACVGMSFVCLAWDKLLLYAAWIVLVHVIFLIYTFQLGLESTEYWINHTLWVDFQPFIDLVRREWVVIISYIETCSGIQSLSTHTFYQIHEFGRYTYFSCFYCQFIDFFSEGFFLHGIGFIRHFIVFGNDFIVKRLFGSPVQCSDLVGTLKHYVLQVVCQSGIFCRIVHWACSAGHNTIYIRFGVVFPYIYGKAILQLECFQPLTVWRQSDSHDSQKNNGINNSSHKIKCF